MLSTSSIKENQDIPNPPDGLIRASVWCAYASGIAAIIGLAFLAIFFTVGGIFGPLNDIAVIIHYVLMLPIAFLVYRLLRPNRPALSLAILLLGLGGMLTVIILQALLVIGQLQFMQQVVMVIPAFLVVTLWFVINEYLGRTEQKLPKGMLMAVLAGLVFGYPFWAFSLGRRLRSAETGSG